MGLPNQLSLSVIEEPEEAIAQYLFRETNQREKEALKGEIQISKKQITYIVEICKGPFRNRFGRLEGCSSHIYFNDEPSWTRNDRPIIPKSLQTLTDRVLESAENLGIVSGSEIFSSQMRIGYVEGYGALPLKLGERGRTITYDPSIAMISTRSARNLPIQPNDHSLTEILVEDNGLAEASDIDNKVREQRPPLIIRRRSDQEAYDDSEKDRDVELRRNGHCTVEFDFVNGDYSKLKPRRKLVGCVEEDIFTVNDDELAIGRRVQDAVINYNDKSVSYDETYIFKRDQKTYNTNPHAIVSIKNTATEKNEEPIDERAIAHWEQNLDSRELRLVFGVNKDKEALKKVEINTPSGSLVVYFEMNKSGAKNFQYLASHPIYGPIISAIMSKEQPTENLYDVAKQYFDGSISDLENTWDQ